MLEVYPSEISPQLIQVVRDRVDCYSQLPENRLSGRCHGKYLNSLLLIGRSNIHDSDPDLGIVLDLVDSCPTMYSVCRGKDLTESYCGEIEAKCLDYFFDQYWRGAPYFTDVQAF
ncbi:MAG: hypothetical protein LBE80_08025 [Deltaproteobacteria bacterium]|nr:hypothetical protein [Deltaproteobacteria bacterium]